MQPRSFLTPSSCILVQRTTSQKDARELLDCATLARTATGMHPSYRLTPSSCFIAQRATSQQDALALLDCATLVRTAKRCMHVIALRHQELQLRNERLVMRMH